MKLKDKVAVVTGGAHGIGKALSENGKVIVTGCMGAEPEKITKAYPGVLAVSGAVHIDSALLAEELAADEAAILMFSGHPDRALAVLERITGSDQRTRVIRAISGAPALAVTGRTARIPPPPNRRSSALRSNERCAE